MQQAEEHQPAHAPVVQRCGTLAGRFDVAGHEKDSRAEEHGKDAHEFQVGE